VTINKIPGLSVTKLIPWLSGSVETLLDMFLLRVRRECYENNLVMFQTLLFFATNDLSALGQHVRVQLWKYCNTFTHTVC